MEELYLDKCVDYITALDKKKDFDALMMEHLRMSAASWELTTLDIMGRLGDEIVAWSLKCQDECVPCCVAALAIGGAFHHVC